MNRRVIVHDPLQDGYSYICIHAPGKGFDSEFTPQLTPKEMLELGVFAGCYFGGHHSEFPKAWFAKARLSKGESDPSLNYFGIAASQSRKEWQKKGWIYKDDPRGWFQWYCRYYMGRRLAQEDARQIKRWKAMRRHIAQVRNACAPQDPFCRPRQKQALLHWAYDTRKL